MGGRGPSGGCSNVEPWGNVTDDMAKNHVQKHGGNVTGRVNYDWTDMTKINPLFTNLDLINLY